MASAGTSFLLLFAALVVGVNSQYTIGRGIADITGCASEASLYGYMRPRQSANGIHMRQYARAFVLDDGDNRFAFVVAEIGMVTQAIHIQVLEELDLVYPNVYTIDNIMLVPTHTHAGPGGYHTYFMYQRSTQGWVSQTFNAITDGIVDAIDRAHQDLKAGTVYINDGSLIAANANRSPYSYEQNPQSERDMFMYDTDKVMTVLKLVDSQQKDLGLISFYPVHGTSLKNYNQLVSSDNKGYASQMMERFFNPGARPGKGSILAAFAQTAAGDVTPNVNGARCISDNSLCTYETSVCPDDGVNDPRNCQGRGPSDTSDQFYDLRVTGEYQYQTAHTLHTDASEVLSGPIDFRVQWVNMSLIDIINTPNTNHTTTCRPGVGYSQMALTTDGPGYPPFTQGMKEEIPFLSNFSDFLGVQDEAYMICHEPKPVLWATGLLEFPWDWQPEIVLLQIVRIGQLFLIGVPFEVTTMAGRRLREAIEDVLLVEGISPTGMRILIMGMANNYASYLTTYEEYQVQRHEGATNSYGPVTLNCVTTLMQEMAAALANNQAVPLGEYPPDLRGVPSNALLPVKWDSTPENYTYGNVYTNTEPFYYTGETAMCTFVAGNPRHNLMTDSTYLEVQHLVGTSWIVDYVDGDYETRFYWDTTCQVDFENNPNCTLASRQNNATITWGIPSDTPAGIYRLFHTAYARTDTDLVLQYVGFSNQFEVLPAQPSTKLRKFERDDTKAMLDVLNHYDNPWQMLA